MMIKKKIILSCCALTLLGFSACNADNTKKASVASEQKAAEQSLYQVFQQPESKYRPFVRWWWNGARVTVPEATRQLDVLKEAGFGGVEINTVGMPEQADPKTFALAPALQWLGNDWISTVNDVVQAAKERDLTSDIIVGSGWPFGGEFLESDEQVQRYRIEKKILQGPLQITLSLADFEKGAQHKKSGEALNDIPATNISYPLLRLVNESSFNQAFQNGTDLLPQVSNNRITFSVPEGLHTLYLGIVEIGYARVKKGAPGADGPILDHYNKPAVQKYLNNMSNKMAAQLGKPMGDLFRASFVDSLELAHSNWTHDMAQQFSERRGYDAGPYMPFILDHSRQDETSRRARYDFSKTQIEIFSERFAQTYVAWAEANGIGSRIQAYGRETHPLHGSMLPSHPEGETWLWIDERERPRISVDSSAINKYVSSAAHYTGKRTVSYEAMTNAQPVFRESLADFKLAFDLTIQSGLNHPIIHGFNYTPIEAGFPGWVRFGCYLNERTPFWPQMKNFNDYAARVGSVMRNSDYQAQIAVLAPRVEEWEQFGLLYQPFPENIYPWYQYRLPVALQKLGYGVDFISEELIEQATIKDGQLTFNNRTYQALILEDVKALSVAATKQLKALAGQQGKIAFIGAKPQRTSSLSPGWQQESKQVESVVSDISGDSVQQFPAPEQPVNYPDHNSPMEKGMAFDDSAMLKFLANVTHALGIQSPVSIKSPSPWVSLVHHISDAEQDILFVSNSSTTEAVSIDLVLNQIKGSAELWDPSNGERYAIKRNANNELHVNLAPAESRLLVFQSDANRNLPQLPKFDFEPATQLDISKDWKLIFKPVLHAQAFDLNGVTPSDLSLHETPNIASFAGVVTYQKQIKVGQGFDQARIDFGAINGTSALRVDGIKIAETWYGKHVYTLPLGLTSGVHTIELDVSTTLANYMRLKKDNPVAQRWSGWFSPVESGVLGPVTLQGVTK